MSDRTFGQWLFEKRREAGLTQPQLAESAGTSKQYVSNLERDAPHPLTGALPRPKVEIVDALARALGAPIAEARLSAGYAPPGEAFSKQVLVDNEFAVLGYEFRKLSVEDQNELRASLEMLKKEVGRRRRMQRVDPHRAK
jgi:transcriptional regulator with XRE-family HTH domain